MPAAGADACRGCRCLPRAAIRPPAHLVIMESLSLGVHPRHDHARRPARWEAKIIAGEA